MHGPGGIGKSTLLRHVRRHGEAAGWTPVLVEARDLPPVPDAPHDALADAREDAAGKAFGDSENEALLHRVLTRGYLDPAPSHEAAADELNLSRAAYFRRLKLASERLAEYLSARSPRVARFRVCG